MDIYISNRRHNLKNLDDCWCDPTMYQEKEGKIIVHHIELCVEVNKDLSEKICICDKGEIH